MAKLNTKWQYIAFTEFKTTLGGVMRDNKAAHAEGKTAAAQAKPFFERRVEAILAVRSSGRLGELSSYLDELEAQTIAIENANRA